MRKIRLDIDDLAVESFDTAAGEGERAGTVRGHDYSQYPCDDPYTSPEVCPSVQTGREDCYGCPVSGNLTCVGCPRDTWSCGQSCAATDGGSICLDPYC